MTCYAVWFYILLVSERSACWICISSGPRFKSCTDCWLNVFLGHLKLKFFLMLVKEPTCYLLPVGIIRAIFVWPWKVVSVSIHYLFYQPMDEKIKTWTLYFSAKENPNKALFDWPIKLQYGVKAKRKFSGMKFFHPSTHLTNQKPRTFESVW